MFEVAPDLRAHFDEVVACDDRVIALRITWRGDAAPGGGEAAVLYGAVAVVEDARMIRIELFEHDDRAAILARYAELAQQRPASDSRPRGGLPAEPTSEPSVLGEKPPERTWAEAARRLNAGDIDGIVALYAEDWVETDRRRLRESVSSAEPLGEPSHGRENAELLWRSASAMNAHLRIDIAEVLACDERAIAGRWRLSGKAAADAGGGTWEISAGSVMVVEDGVFVSSDRYEYDERDAMLARYVELGGT
jgi:hypothetical protein